jgi:RimJ/RimL family protein N-acetyltransferase
MSDPFGFETIARGETTLLRRKRLSDARADYAWQQDPELARLDGRQPPTESYEEFLGRFRTNLEFPMDSSAAFSIDDIEGRHVGNLVRYNAVAGACEFGISLGEPEARGRGLGRDAICTFLRWAWGSIQWEMVYAHTFEWNEAARACLAHCGMRAAAFVERPAGRMIRYEAQRAWWLMEDEREPYPRRRIRRAADTTL